MNLFQHENFYLNLLYAYFYYFLQILIHRLRLLYFMMLDFGFLILKED